MDKSAFSSSDSDEDDSLIVTKRRKTLKLFEDSDEEEADQDLGNARLARRDDDILSDDSDASAKTEVIAETDTLMTDADVVDEDFNNVVNGTNCSARRFDEDDDDELLSIHSDDENYNQQQQAEVESFDSDETNFEEPASHTSPLSPSHSEPGTSASLSSSSSSTKILRTRKEIPEVLEVIEVEDEVEASASSSSTNYEPESSSSSSADFGSDTDFKVSRTQRKKVAPLTQSVPAPRSSPVKYETISDSDDEESEPVIPVPRRDRAPPPLTTELPWINVDSLNMDFDTPPPVYNPSAASKADWMGDVQRTVHMMDETIKGMPLPDDEDNEDIKLPPGLVELYPHQKYALRWMSWREGQFPGGGILADEMGLGKTIEIIALIMKSKWDAGVRANGKEQKMVSNEEAGPRCVPSSTTLVVCPLGCIPQWCREMETKGKNLRVLTYHGTKKLTSAAEIAKYDVVITTYQTIANEIPKPNPEQQQTRRCRSPLKRVYWVRIVLDEAHQIRNPKTNAAQALYQLEARHRWAVTGTPIHNRPEDFYSMCTFLRLEPFNDRQVWDFWIGLKTVKRGAEQRLHVLGKALILRRTKEEVGLMGAESGSKCKGQVIPPKDVEVVNIELKDAERSIYNMLMDYAQNILKDFLSQKEQRENGLRLGGLIYAADRVQERREACPEDIKFSHIFALLTRLRQCAVLPHLIETMLEQEELGEDELFDEMKPEHIVSKINPVFDRLYLSSKFEKVNIYNTN